MKTKLSMSILLCGSVAVSAISCAQTEPGSDLTASALTAVARRRAVRRDRL